MRHGFSLLPERFGQMTKPLLYLRRRASGRHRLSWYLLRTRIELLLTVILILALAGAVVLLVWITMHAWVR